MNKRADIPVTILVMGVFLICGLAISSFAISVSLNKKHPIGTGLFEEIHSDVEKFYFYLEEKPDKGVAAKKIDAEFNGNQLIIQKSNEIISINYTKNLE